MRVGRPPRRNLSCAPISRRPPDREPPLTATIPVRQGHPVISATHDMAGIRLPAFGKPQPSARNMRARRIRELLVRSPGLSRRGPGLASQRAGRWRARPAKAGTPYQELANAPCFRISALGFPSEFGFRVSDLRTAAPPRYLQRNTRVSPFFMGRSTRGPLPMRSPVIASLTWRRLPVSRAIVPSCDACTATIGPFA